MQAELIHLRIDHESFDAPADGALGDYYLMRHDNELYVNQLGGPFNDVANGLRAIDFWFDEHELAHGGNPVSECETRSLAGACAFFYLVQTETTDGKDYTLHITRSPRHDEVVITKFRVTVLSVAE